MLIIVKMPNVTNTCNNFNDVIHVPAQIKLYCILQGYRYGPAVWTNFPNISDQKQESSGNTLLLFIGRLMSIKWDSGTEKRGQKLSICRYIGDALCRIIVYHIRHLITSFSPISVSFNTVVLFTEWFFCLIHIVTIYVIWIEEQNLFSHQTLLKHLVIIFTA